MLSIVLLAIVFLYRRFRRTAGDVPWTCQAAAAIALSFGVVTAIAGAGQSVPVPFFTLSEREYGNLQVLCPLVHDWRDVSVSRASEAVPELRG